MVFLPYAAVQGLDLGIAFSHQALARADLLAGELEGCVGAAHLAGILLELLVQDGDFALQLCLFLCGAGLLGETLRAGKDGGEQYEQYLPHSSVLFSASMRKDLARSFSPRASSTVA